MKEKLLLLFLCITSLCSAQITKKVLFIGNSYTAVNDLPSIVSSMATNSGDILIFDSNLPGGFRFMNHASNLTTLSKINSNTWDYVVLQAQSQETAFSQTQMSNEVFPYATTLSNLIRQNNTCSQPMFYMTWGRQNGDSGNCPYIPWVCNYESMDNVIRTSYLSMAQNNLAELAPAGAVWRYLRENNPTINLYSSDESHPSVEGSYAAACAFYTMIFKKDPSLLTWNSTLSASVASSIRLAAKTIVFDQMETWDFTVNPAVADFTESVNAATVNFTNASNANDSLLWDFGDGNYSLEQSPIHVYTESGFYTVSLTVIKCGKSATQTKTLSITIDLKINEVAGEKLFSVFPNPASVIINANLYQVYKKIETDIFDIRGTKLLSRQMYNADFVSLDIYDLQTGLYFMKIVADDATYSCKFIKVN